MVVLKTKGAILKALSVISPWGDKIANKEKRLEIRKWRPETLPLKDIAIVQNKNRLSKDKIEDPEGHIVAIVDIVSCKPWTINNCIPAVCNESDFSPNLFAWEITNIRKPSTLIKATAKRKFYELSNEEAVAISQINLE
jgi:hypothetical protein